MRRLYYLLLFCSLGLLSVLPANSQPYPKLKVDESHSKSAIQKVLSETNSEYLRALAKRVKTREDSIRVIAYRMAAEKGWETRKIYDDGSTIELMGVSESGQPLYNETYNSDAARTTSTNGLHPGGDLSLNLSGTGMIIGEWDSGDVRSSHVEFTNTGFSRVVDMDGTTELTNHATHVAGTLIGGGDDPQARGMAYNGTLHAYDWTNSFDEVADAAADGLLISNHSYGFISGWRYDSSEEVWEWWGDESISSEEDYNFGFYTWACAVLDDVAFNAPYHLYVKSAGNDRGDWDGSSTIHPPDGGEDGYDCIGHRGNAKNILTVGAIHDLPNGYTNASAVDDASFSGMGPADDGRIKPDIVGNGIGLWSSLAGSDNEYESYSGTSMSAPNVAGSLLLLQQHHEDLNGEFMRAATLKGLVIATADEAGPSFGPDYKFGWGVLNTANAATVIAENGVTTQIHEETYSGGTETFAVTASGSEPIVATLVWTDPAGNVPAASLDPTDPALVNDLDLRITSGTDIFSPFKLSPSNPSAAATTGINHADNVEKIVIQNPIPDQTYTLEISHTGIIDGGQQNYSLIITGLAPIPLNDLRVSRLFGLKKVGQSEELHNPIFAEIVNSGTTTVQDAEVELNVSGANEFSSAVTLSLVESTDTSLVVFGGYQPTNLGENDVVITLEDDDNNGNNNATFEQETTESSYSYLSDVSFQEGSVGYGDAEGAILVKYPISGTKTLSEIRVFISEGIGNTIRPVVLDSMGTILANGDLHSINPEDVGEWLDLPLTNTAEVSNMFVYAGVEAYAAGSAWFPVGTQFEDPTHPDAYYAGPIEGGEPLLGPFRTLNRWMIELETCNNLPEGYSLSGPETLCEGSIAEYIIESPGGGNFEWSFPSGWDSEINGTSVVVTPNGNSGEITITALNSCGSGELSSISIEVYPSFESEITVNLCEGESFQFPDGSTVEDITANFVHTSSFESSNGCDSLVFTNVELYNIEDGMEEVLVCAGESLQFPDGSTVEDIASDFVQTSTIQSSIGCDSLVFTNVGVYVIEDGSEQAIICQGESFTFPDGSVEENIQEGFSYTSVLQSLSGCDSLVNSEIGVALVESSILLEAGTLIAPDNMNSYQWLDCDENFDEIAGANAMTYTPEQNGNYAVVVTNALGCSATSLCFEMLVVSAAEVGGRANFKVFPNPSDGEISIFGIRASGYKLFNATGKLIRNKSISAQSEIFKLDFSDLSSGVYTLKLQTDRGYENVRIVIE